MVQTRSRTRTQQREVAAAVTPKTRPFSTAPNGQSSSTPKAKENSRKRGGPQNGETAFSPAVKKSRSNVKNDADKPKRKQRTRSLSRPQAVQHEVLVNDTKEDAAKPKRMLTRSVSRSRSVYYEICDEPAEIQPTETANDNVAADPIPAADDALLRTPENHNTSDEMREAALRGSQTFDHYSTAYSYTPRRVLAERSAYPSWSHHYYDLQSPHHLRSDYPIFRDPMILRSDSLIDDQVEYIYEHESDKESILPTPSSSLDSSSEDSLEQSLMEEDKYAEKNEPSFFKKFCSVM